MTHIARTSETRIAVGFTLGVHHTQVIFSHVVQRVRSASVRLFFISLGFLPSTSVSHLVKGWLEERFSGTDRIGRVHDDDVIPVVPLQRAAKNKL